MSVSLIGRKLGKYEIQAYIGKGGMATVYKGYDRDVDRYVAVKVLPQLGQDEQYINRFRLEARTIARLQHPHILPLYDYGDQEGLLYLVTPYMDGGSLADRIHAGPIPPEQTERLLHQIASALDYAHRQGIIHRDIKPENILLNREGYALLADFGIVKLAEATGTLTGGAMVGTPAYMAPEQGGGMPVDHRADIYALGIVVYEMLTGRKPYDADTPMQLVMAHIRKPIPKLNLPGLPATLDEALARALAKPRDERYATASSFADDFTRALRGEPLLPLRQHSATGERAETLLFEDESTASTPAISSTPPASTPLPNVQTLPQGTVVVGQTISPLVLLGGFAIIAVMVVVVVALLIRPPAVVPPVITQPAPTAESAPQDAAAAPTPAPDRTAIAARPVFAPSVGAVRFSSGERPGDTVNLRVENLALPPEGMTYVAWLINTETEEAISLGALALDAFGSGQLTYTAPEGDPLPTVYNAVALAVQRRARDTQPGEIRYQGALPRGVTIALRRVLVVDDEDGVRGGLLAGALNEANIASRHAGLAAGATNVGALHLHAEHTINILNGTQEDLNGDGSGQNPGSGVGVMTFLEMIDTSLDRAAGDPDATPDVQTQIELIRVCTSNARQWAQQIVALERQLLAADGPETVQTQMAESTALANTLLDGTDLNGNGQIEPFEGECGLAQIAAYGISVGNIEIRAVDGA